MFCGGQSFQKTHILRPMGPKKCYEIMMIKNEILKNTHKNVIKCRLLTTMDPKGNQQCSTLSPRNAFWPPWAVILLTRGHLQPFSSHWLPKSRQNEPESLQNTLSKVTHSIHLNKVNLSQQRPLIQSNITESARKQIKPCTQIRYKSLIKPCHSTGQAECS